MNSRIFSPKSDIRLPGEFESQEYIVIGCGQLIRHYPQTFVELIGLLHQRVKVIGIAAPGVIKLGEILLGIAGMPKTAVEFIPLKTSSMWVRDFSPIGALNRTGERVFLKFRHSHMRNRDDIGIAEVFENNLPGKFKSVDVYMEGGNLLTNGNGFGLSSKTMVLQNSNRANHEQLSQILEKEAGLSQWACTTPLNGERTGHIDLLATFLNPNLVCIGKVDERDDPNNASILDDLAGALSGYETSSGKLRVVRAPMPYSGDTHFRSYQNVIFANGLLIVPAYPDIDPKQSVLVRNLYAEWMPDWEIALLNCEEISKKGGSLHCITMNVPQPINVKRDSGLEVRNPEEILPR